MTTASQLFAVNLGEPFEAVLMLAFYKDEPEVCHSLTYPTMENYCVGSCIHDPSGHFLS